MIAALTPDDIQNAQQASAAQHPASLIGLFKEMRHISKTFDLA